MGAPGRPARGGDGAGRRHRGDLAALALTLLLAGAAPGLTQDLTQGVAAFERARLAYADNDHPTARAAAIEAAGAGAAQAMVMAGLMLERGQGGPVDFAGARGWYEQAAAQDDADALMALARLAALGRAGLSPTDARDYLRRAHMLGAPGAALTLGEMLARGLGGPPDPQAARALLQREADKGETAALRALALIALDHENDPLAARALLERAADLGDAQAAFEAGSLWLDDDAPEALSRAADLMQAAAEKGHAGAATLLAHALYQGAGRTQDRDGAVGWYRRAAEGGDGEGAFYYAVMLYAGAGAPASVEDALYWTLRSEAADPQAATGYGPRRAALRAQVEAGMNNAGLRAEIAARAARDAGRAD